VYHCNFFPISFSATGDVAEDEVDDGDLRSFRVMNPVLSSASPVADLPVSDGYQIEEKDGSLASPSDDR
jgi:hypothetical protein